MDARGAALLWILFWIILLLDSDNKLPEVPAKDLYTFYNDSLHRLNLLNETVPLNASVQKRIDQTIDSTVNGSLLVATNVSSFLKGVFSFSLHPNASHIHNQTVSEHDPLLELFQTQAYNAFQLSLSPNTSTVHSDTPQDDILGNNMEAFTKRQDTFPNPSLNETAFWIDGRLRFKKDGYWGLAQVVEDPKLIFSVKGVYIKSKALVYLIANASDFGAFDRLLWYVQSDDFETVKQFARLKVMDEMVKLNQSIAINEDAGVTGTFEKERCSWHLVIQYVPLEKNVSVGMNDDLHANVLMFSPECGYLLTSEASQVVGLTNRHYLQKAKHFAVFMTVTLLAQLILMIQQRKYTASQSALSRISPWTIGCQVMIDAYLCLITFTSSLVFSRLFSPLIVCAFFSFILFAVYEMQYQLQISQVQQRQGDEETRQSRWGFFAFIAFWIAFQGMLRSTLVFTVVLFTLYSFWTPQIYINIKRNSRKAFTKKYLYLQSLVRLALPAYLFLCPDNVMDYRQTFPVVFYALTGWMCLQVVVLSVHDFIGPRFMLPRAVIHLYHLFIHFIV